MPDPFAPLEIVLVDPGCRDEALDPEMDFDEYGRTRDPDLIKERAGARARRFRLTGVTRPFLFDVIDAQDANSIRYGLALMAGCHSFVDEAGERHEAKTRLSGGPGTQLMAGSDWIDRLVDVVGAAGVYEIGRVVRNRAALPKARKQP